MPRGRRKGNWKHSILSRRDAVYLTNAYALYFAVNAQRNKDERLAIVEIDTAGLNPWLLVPDEDAIEQLNRGKDGLDGSLEQRTKHYRKELPRYVGHSQWEASLKALGNCAYMGHIAANAITRVAYIDVKQAPMLILAGMDPSITLMNYLIIGKKYRGLTKWIFGDQLEEDSPVERINLNELQAAYPDVPKSVIDSMRFDYILPPDSEKTAIEVQYLGGRNV